MEMDISRNSNVYNFLYNHTLPYLCFEKDSLENLCQYVPGFIFNLFTTFILYFILIQGILYSVPFGMELFGEYDSRVWLQGIQDGLEFYGLPEWIGIVYPIFVVIVAFAIIFGSAFIICILSFVGTGYTIIGLHKLYRKYNPKTYTYREPNVFVEYIKGKHAKVCVLINYVGEEK